MSTIDEIAKRAGVSKWTVARILKGETKGVWRKSARRAEKIRAMAEEMGYRPNTAAKAVATGRFGCVALLTSAEGHSVPAIGMHRGAVRQLARHDMRLVIADPPDELLTGEEYVPNVLRELSVDGIMLYSRVGVDPRLVKLVKAHKIPTVFLDDRRASDCVRPDDEGAAHEATHRLVQLGHRKIAYVSFDEGRHYSEADRIAGYEAAMREASLKPRTETEPVPWKDRVSGGDRRLERARRLLSRRDRPTAVVAYSHLEAFPLLYAAALEGLRVPDDLSLVSFHDFLLADMGAEISVMWVDTHRLGELAVEMLLRKIERPRKSQKPQVLPYTFSGEHTVGPRS